MLKGFSVECMEFLNEDAQQKGENDPFHTSLSRKDQFSTSAKFFDIMHGSYGFSADLIDYYQLMNINIVSLILVGVITGFAVMCKDSWQACYLNACMLILLYNLVGLESFPLV